jgi:hypothetical protein
MQRGSAIWGGRFLKASPGAPVAGISSSGSVAMVPPLPSQPESTPAWESAPSSMQSARGDAEQRFFHAAEVRQAMDEASRTEFRGSSRNCRTGGQAIDGTHGRAGRFRGPPALRRHYAFQLRGDGGRKEIRRR